MEIIEMIGWIALGFSPMFAALEIVGKKLPSRKAARMVVLKSEKGGDTTIGL
jgi:hypothetical protein